MKSIECHWSPSKSRKLSPFKRWLELLFTDNFLCLFFRTQWAFFHVPKMAQLRFFPTTLCHGRDSNSRQQSCTDQGPIEECSFDWATMPRWFTNNLINIIFVSMLQLQSLVTELGVHQPIEKSRGLIIRAHTDFKIVPTTVSFWMGEMEPIIP